MKKKLLFVLSIIILIYLNFSHLDTQVTSVKVGSFNQFSDAGSPKTRGTATYNEQTQTYLLKGSGSNIWFGNDSFSFLSKKMNGDFILQTQVHWSCEVAKSHRKTGIMIRSSLALDTTMIAFTTREECLYRKKAKENLEQLKFALRDEADMLQVERKGNTYILYLAHFGEIFQVQKLENVDLGTEVM
jgi:TolB protein